MSHPQSIKEIKVYTPKKSEQRAALKTCCDMLRVNLQQRAKYSIANAFKKGKSPVSILIVYVVLKVFFSSLFKMFLKKNAK